MVFITLEVLSTRWHFVRCW